MNSFFRRISFGLLGILLMLIGNGFVSNATPPDFWVPWNLVCGLEIVGLFFVGRALLPIAHKLQMPDWTTAEYTELGSIVAYRYFLVDGDGNFRSVNVEGYKRGHVWTRDNPFQVSDRVPTAKNKSGFYAAKKPLSPILSEYKGKDGFVLTKVELSGRVVETEYGFRAQNCRILEFLEIK